MGMTVDLIMLSENTELVSFEVARCDVRAIEGLTSSRD
jgi:hypothetical protein